MLGDLMISTPRSESSKQRVLTLSSFCRPAASATALAAKQATSTIPIVLAALGNPVALGLAASDSRLSLLESFLYFDDSRELSFLNAFVSFNALQGRQA